MKTNASLEICEYEMFDKEVIEASGHLSDQCAVLPFAFASLEKIYGWSGRVSFYKSSM